MASPATTHPTGDRPEPPRAAPRQRRGAPVVAAPLGSLTQRDHQSSDGCALCGSASVTTLSITLTDGTPARFASCRTCGHREWADEDGALSIDDVLERTAKA